jgi:transposase
VNGRQIARDLGLSYSSVRMIIQRYEKMACAASNLVGVDGQRAVAASSPWSRKSRFSG